jgi:predicted RNase H-like HicB family nuclease
MKNSYKAVIKRDGAWWIGWIEEVPGVNCQEKTKARLITSLKTALKEALELNKNEAIEAAGGEFKEERISL